MDIPTNVECNVKQAVPFFWVRDIKNSSRFYSDGLGFNMTKQSICQDALTIYREFTSRGVQAKRPFVSNGMWVTEVTDPDGYNLSFQSLTDVSEETVLPDNNL